MKTIYSLILVIFLASTFMACRKDNKTDDAPVTPAEGSREQLTLDSLFLYAKEMYLWYDALPDYATFNPRQYATGGDVLSNYEKELFLITQYKINPSTGNPYEYSGYPGRPKYSFMEEGSPTTGTSGSVSLADKGDDFGLALTAVSASDIRIRYVNPVSAADDAGLVRGDQILAVNGNTISSSSSSYVDAALAQSTVTLSVKKGNGTTSNVTLTQHDYTTNPVFKDTVLTAGTQKVGYVAVSRFSAPASFTPALKEVFSTFATAGVTALVIDLRYNGGGYTQAAEDLVNLVAPSALNGKVMYTEYFNTLLQNGKAPILKQQLYLDANGKPVTYQGRNATYADIDYSVSGNTYTFKKEGTLQTVKQVVFIVSGGTASASELTINSLKPYMPVKLVGQQTYGKPVGFFGIKIDAYTVYMSSFTMQNSSGEGDYFHGMTPDISANDDITHDFGDPSENCLAAALSYISGNPSGRTGNVESSPLIHMGPSSFNGMIENRAKFR
ncbi:PDZ domain (Also known as DHR or GLGF) [Chitinophaga sp. CF118]|uniref:S41 family peptidase n=1 Tax=Chitinophaga sp. CF118 TaxID=1884367 RepID=UPI0008F40298|nr:S41 family peptidase [Chitinophaga sp. CF118]SFD18494.1 PDZ domain (Also known as DHR or GLGF) [Chitinophaga sp. CF118]